MGKRLPAWFKKRLAEITKAELRLPEKWHYVSFADDTKGGFQGVVVIKGHGITDCVSKCTRLGINPGGQVMCVPFADIGMMDSIPEGDRNRLLNREDVLRLWPDSKTLAEWEKEDGEAGRDIRER